MLKIVYFSWGSIMERKPLIWVASSKKDVSGFPEDVRRTMGYGLHQAQIGKKSDNAKVLKGFGSADVLEFIDEVLLVHIERCIQFSLVSPSVLIRTKSKQGIKTPERDLSLIKNRLKLGQDLYKVLFNKKGKL